MSQDRVDRHNFNAYRAALIEYNHADVYSSRSIHVEATPLLLLRDVSSVILQSAEQLLDAYWEWIDDEILGLLFDPDSESPLVTESHSRGDIIPLLRTKIVEHERVLTRGPQDASILGEWYSLLQTLNDVWLCYTNPPDNYIRVELEADLPTFAKQLLEHEAQSFDPRLVLVTSDEERFKAVGFSQSAKLDEQSAAQLGQLLVLSQATDSEWRMNAVYQAFWKWADAFNNRGA